MVGAVGASADIVVSDDVLARLPPEALSILCRCHPSPANERAARYRDALAAREVSDWGYLVDQATLHRVVTIMATTEVPGLPPLAPHVRRLFTGFGFYTEARNRAIITETASVLLALREAGVVAMPRKGVVLAPLHYQDLRMRYMSDTDLFVPREQLAQAEAVLGALGYVEGDYVPAEGKVVPESRETSIFWRLHTSALPDYRRPSEDPSLAIYSIDLRHDVFEPGYPKSLPASTLAARAVGGEGPFSGVWMLSELDMLVDVCTHLHREAITLIAIEGSKDFQLVRSVDVATWFAGRGREIPPPEIVEHVQRLDVAKEVYYAFHVTEQCFPGSVPPDVLDPLRPADLSYLDAYGELDDRPGVWDRPFLERVFDASRRHAVSDRSRLPRT